MLVNKRSMVSGKWHVMKLPITNDQIERWQNGKFIQNAMPDLDDEQREFLMTGITPDEWNANFGETEENV
tara:strand:- start:527 stop:736 length:210 start_codon:yes stop_codon:yes gene_type:complete